MRGQGGEDGDEMLNLEDKGKLEMNRSCWEGDEREREGRKGDKEVGK